MNNKEKEGRMVWENFHLAYGGLLVVLKITQWKVAGLLYGSSNTGLLTTIKIT